MNNKPAPAPIQPGNPATLSPANIKDTAARLAGLQYRPRNIIKY